MARPYATVQEHIAAGLIQLLGPIVEESDMRVQGVMESQTVRENLSGVSVEGYGEKLGGFWLDHALGLIPHVEPWALFKS